MPTEPDVCKRQGWHYRVTNGAPWGRPDVDVCDDCEQAVDGGRANINGAVPYE